MMKNYYWILLLCLIASRSYGQCATNPPAYIDRYAFDTTFVTIVADTAAGTAGYTYHWEFSDGTIMTGPVVERWVTTSGAGIYYTLTVTDPLSCVSSYNNEFDYNQHTVLHCDSFQASDWDLGYGYWVSADPNPIQLLDWPDPNSVTLGILPRSMLPGYDVGPFSDNANLQHNIAVTWGNGVTTYKTAGLFDGNATLMGSGAPYVPGYIWGGEYRIDAQSYISLGTLTCPARNMHPMTIRIEGRLAPPEIIGSREYCEGDTLYLVATDTTLQFHNMFHYTDTTGHSPLYYNRGNPDSYEPMLPVGRSTYYFEWLDHNMNVVSTDTTLLLYNLTQADSGTYMFHMVEHRLNSFHDTFFYVHVSVNAMPAPLAISGLSSVCVGATITLTNNIPGGMWTASNTGATVTDGTVTGVTAGTTTISYAMANACLSALATQDIEVIAVPAPGYIYGPDTICLGAVETLTFSGTNGGVWSSYHGHVSMSGGVMTGVSLGQDTVTYLFTNSCGTSGGINRVAVIGVPDAGTITGPSSLCMPGVITLTAGSTAGTWTATNGAVSITASGVVTGLASGVDTIVYTVTNVCGSDADTTIVTVGDLPVSGTIFGIDTVCVGASAILTTSGVGGTWTSSDSSVIDITTGGLISAVSAGTATVSYSVTNSCGTSTTAHSVYVKSAADCGISVAGVQPDNNHIEVYPNPAHDRVTVHNNVANEHMHIVIFDAQGRMVRDMNETAGNGKLEIDLADLAAGMYHFKISTDDAITYIKIVKE